MCVSRGRLSNRTSDGEWLVLNGFDVLSCHSLICVSSGRLWNRAARWGMAGVGCGVLPRVGASGIERLNGEWLVLMWCAATDGGLQWALVESSV